MLTFPHHEEFVFRDLPRPEGYVVEFRLIYYGVLPAAASKDTRATEKQAIRKFIHPQLREWWNQNQGNYLLDRLKVIHSACRAELEMF